jgi:hypothetical protein
MSDRWKIEPDLIDPSKGQRDMEAKFPGFEGLPFRGHVPNLKTNDPEPMQPRQGARVHVEILEMSKEDDRKRMAHVFTLVANGTAVISAEEREYDIEAKNWRIFLRWADLFTYNPQRGV